MHLQALRYLLAVAEEGHFGRAAARMHISQPSVSQAVARLEEQFGARLLDRSGARVVPTEAGERVLVEVRSVLSHLDRAIGAATSAAAGPLRIACTPFFAMWVAAELLAPFRAAHPDVHVSVAELYVPAQVRALVAGEVDVVVGEPLTADPRFHPTVIREDPCCIWMSTDYVLTELDEIPLSRLTGVALVDADPELHPGYRAWLHAALEAEGVAATLAEPSRDSPTTISRMIAGTVVSLAADIMPEGTIPGMAVRPVSDPVRWPWTATTLRAAPPKVALSFIAWACAWASSPTLRRTAAGR